MIKVLGTSRELTKVEQYKMTLGREITVLKDVPDGTMIDVDAFCEYIDVKDDGSEVTLLSILDKDGQVYSCQSATFRRSFSDICDIMVNENGFDNFSIKKLSGVTKAGRPFIDCALV